MRLFLFLQTNIRSFFLLSALAIFCVSGARRLRRRAPETQKMSSDNCCDQG